MRHVVRHLLLTIILACMPFAAADAGDSGGRSFHAGFLHPSGVDLIGYSNEHNVTGGLYRFYTFGFPSLAALGLNYYADYEGKGIVGTIGIGIGSVLYASVAYQIPVRAANQVKLGVGYTAGVAYSGIYPVLGFEYRY